MRDAPAQISREEHDSAAAAELPSGDGAVVNTYYRTVPGAGRARHQPRRSAHRCVVARDSGYTRAYGPFTCLWFARGACYKGRDCTYQHRLPSARDQAEIGSARDCFGRTKFAEADERGVGSFLRPSKTLVVTRFSQKNEGRVKQQIRDQFSEWGELEAVELKKGAAFVTYKRQLCADFAKEAMLGQTVTGKETLDVRWAERRGLMASDEEEKLVRAIVRKMLAGGAVTEPQAEASGEIGTEVGGEAGGEAGGEVEDLGDVKPASLKRPHSPHEEPAKRQQ